MNKSIQKFILIIFGVMGALVALVMLGLPYLLEIQWGDPVEKRQEYLRQGDAYWAEGKINAAIIEWRNASRIDSMDAQAHFRLGKAYMELDDPVKALAGLEKGLRLDPSNTEAQMIVGKWYYSYGLHEWANDKVNIVLKQDSTHVEALQLRALLLAFQKDYFDAFQVVRRILEQDPDNVEAKLQMGRLYYLTGDMEQAESVLAEVAAQQDTSFLAQRTLADFFRARGDRQAEKAVLEKALARHPQNSLAYARMGDFYLARGDTAQALKHYRRGVLVDPDNSGAHFGLGYFFTIYTQVDSAVAYYRKALDINPYHLQARKHLINLRLVQWGVDEADELLKPILAQQPSDLDAQYFLGRIRLAQKRYDVAREVLERLADRREAYKFDIFPHDLSYYLGLAFYMNRQYTEAAGMLRRQLTINPQEQRAVILLADALLQSGDPESAYLVAKEAAITHDGDVRVTLLMGQALMRLGEDEEVRRGLEMTLEGWERYYQRKPESLSVALQYGQALQAADQLQRAEEVFTKMRQRHQRSLIAHLVLGQFYASTGRDAQAEAVYREALDEFSETAEIYAVVGDFFRSRQRYDEAEEVYRDGIDEVDDGSMLQAALGGFYVERGRNEDALAAYLEAKEMAPESLAIRKQVAYLQLIMGQDGAAQSTVQGILRAQPGDPEATFLRGRIALVQGDAKAAVEMLEPLVSLRPGYAWGLGRGQMPAAYYLALAYWRLDDPEASRAALQRMPAQYLQLPLARLLDAEIAQRLGEAVDTDAVAAAKEVLEANPTNSAAKLLLGKALGQRGQWQEAERIFSDLVAANDKNRLAYFGLAEAMAAQGRDAEAIAAYERVLQLDKRSIEALEGLARVYLRSGKEQQAIQRAAEQVKRLPRDPQVHEVHARLALQLGQDAQAENSLKKAIALDGSRILPHFLLANLHQHQQKYAEAKAGYERILRLDPANAVAANNLAWIFLESGGDLLEARRLAQTADRALPDNPNIKDTLGWIHYREGQYAAAIPYFEAALALAPDDPLFHFHLGMARYKEGEMVAARTALERSLKLDASHDQAQVARQTLDKITRGG